MRLFTSLLKTCVPVVLLTLPAGADNDHPFIGGLDNIKTVASTIPGNGDLNPYGIAVVPNTIGRLEAQSILVSNFNNAGNKQGTGITIVEIRPDGDVKVFAKLDDDALHGPCPGGVGLTTALVALRSGFVIVGSLPSSNGTAMNAKAGCLIVLDRNGEAVGTLSGNGIEGPWDMTAVDLGGAAVLFVSNVLDDTVAANGKVVKEGTVLRIVLSTPSSGTPKELGRTVIASGFPQRTDPNALVIGPTGLAISGDGRLFVADTLGNRIAAIPNALTRLTDAGTGNTIFKDGALNAPLGLAIAPNGHILTVNSGDGNMVEITADGEQVAVKPVDISKMGAGTLFGLAIAPNQHGVYFVDDGNNTLNLLH